jgi:hypothetical protein
MSADCVFCQIAAKRAPGHYVYPDACCTAFLDVSPFNPGHPLVVPNEHFARLSELPPHIGAQLFKVAMRISHAIVGSAVKASMSFFPTENARGRRYRIFTCTFSRGLSKMDSSSIAAGTQVVRPRWN